MDFVDLTELMNLYHLQQHQLLIFNQLLSPVYQRSALCLALIMESLLHQAHVELFKQLFSILLPNNICNMEPQLVPSHLMLAPLVRTLMVFALSTPKVALP